MAERSRGARVFLSHRAAEREFAEQIRVALERSGFYVWSDEEIRPGDSLPGSLGTALKSADAVVLLLAGGSSQGPWVSLELGTAIAMGKRVIPVLVEPGAEVPVLLEGIQYLDLSDPSTREREIERLAAAVVGSPSRSSTADGIEFVELASDELRRERRAFEAASERRSVSMLGHQVAFALGAIVAGGIGLAVSAIGNGTRPATLVAAGAVALSWALGFYLGSEQRGRR